MRVVPYPRCNLVSAWLLEVESSWIDDPEEDTCWCAEGIDRTICIIRGEDTKHAIGKSGRTLQRLQPLSGTFIGGVDLSNETSQMQIYGRCKGRNIVNHFLSCLHEGFYVVLGTLERALGASG